MDAERLLTLVALFAVAGLATGFLSGLFGIGGGIVRIPLFIYLLPLAGVTQEVLMHMAIGTSVALIVPTAIMATRKQVHLGNLDLPYYRSWAIGIFFGVVLGMFLLPFIATGALKIIFIVFLVVVGVYVGVASDAMVIGPRPPEGWLKLSIAGAIGCCAALTGTAGGALTTPILKAFSYPLPRAIAMASASGLVIGVVSSVAVVLQGWNAAGRPVGSFGYIDLIVLAAMLPTTMIGAPLGVRAAHRLNPLWLKRSYAALLFLAALDMAAKIVA